MDLLEEIRVIKARQKWKIKDLSRIWGVGKVQVHYRLSGRTEIKWRHFIALCDEAGITPKISYEPKK